MPDINVAPYVGAWIETETTEVKEKEVVSLPTWERGLKLIIQREKII